MAAVTTQTIALQPDIHYAPDREKYQARVRRRLQAEALSARSLPAGFPHKLTSDLVWDGATVAQEYHWNFVLSRSHIAELQDALTYFKC